MSRLSEPRARPELARPRGGMRQILSTVALLTHTAVGVARVDDQSCRVVEDLPRADSACAVSHGGRAPPRATASARRRASSRRPAPSPRMYAPGIPAGQCQPGDEVVQDEVAQHHDARPLSQRVHDPTVCLRVVAEVVERDVGLARAGRRRRATSTSNRRSSAGGGAL